MLLRILTHVGVFKLDLNAHFLEKIGENLFRSIQAFGASEKFRMRELHLSLPAKDICMKNTKYYV